MLIELKSLFKIFYFAINRKRKKPKPEGTSSESDENNKKTRSHIPVRLSPRGYSMNDDDLQRPRTSKDLHIDSSVSVEDYNENDIGRFIGKASVLSRKFHRLATPLHSTPRQWTKFKMPHQSTKMNQCTEFHHHRSQKRKSYVLQRYVSLSSHLQRLFLQKHPKRILCFYNIADFTSAKFYPKP
ncbi:hypothetical protein PGB90_000801 [Kerria lacca]